MKWLISLLKLVQDHFLTNLSKNLYDLDKDPFQENNLAKEQSNTLQVKNRLRVSS